LRLQTHRAIVLRTGRPESVRQFAERHLLKFTDVLKREGLAIGTTFIANILVKKAALAEVITRDRIPP
jgi:hypothetical protein